MESDEETAAAIVALLLVKKNKKKIKKSACVKSWLGRRINLSFYDTLAPRQIGVQKTPAHKTT